MSDSTIILVETSLYHVSGRNYNWTSKERVLGKALLEASIQRGSLVHKASLIPMDNAVLALFYEGNIKIGTLAVSTSGLREGSMGTSSVLLGGKYLIAARALAEKVAAIFNKMGIVSLNTQLAEGEALRLYSTLLDKARNSGATGSEESDSKG